MDSLGTPTLAEGRYRLEEVLGQGGMATVYRALDTRLGVERAIKVLEPAFVKSRTIRARFETEARTMARLSHPNILQVVDVAEDKARVFIVMALAPGGSLWDRVRELGPLPPALACRLLAAVSDAAALAHQHGVVHRDIKPQNLLLSADGTPLLTDFGIAQVHDPAREQALTRTGTVMGTWAYMAPEQRSSAREADARTDVYALGASLYALVVGEVPPDLFAASMDQSLLAGLDPALAALVAHATRYHKEDRIESAGALAQALRVLMDQLPPPSDAARAMLRAPLSASGGDLPHPDSGSGRVGDARETDGGTVAGLLDDAPSSEVPVSTLRDPPSLDVPGTVEESLPSDRRGRRPVFVWVVLAVVMVGLLVVVIPPSTTEIPDEAGAVPAAGPARPQDARVVAANPVDGSGSKKAAAPEAPPMGVSPSTSARAPDGGPSSRGAARAAPTGGSAGTGVDAAPQEDAASSGPARTDGDDPSETGAAEPTPPDALPPSPSPPQPARVEVLGTVTDVVLVDAETGDEHLAGDAVPAGRYKVLARFAGNTQRSVALRLDLEPEQHVVLRCDDVFDKCTVVD